MGDVWILIAVLVIVAFFVLALIFGFLVRPNDDDFGTWETKFQTKCLMGDEDAFCNQTGTQTTIQRCIRSKEGLGCLDDDGNQTFNDRYIQEPCTPPCRSSIWQTLKGPCESESEGCSVIPTGTRTVKMTCVSHDPTGSNDCVLVEPRDFRTLSNVEQYIQRVEYNVGETVEFTEVCDDISTPLCGNWDFYTPAIPGTYQPDELTKSSCVLSPIAELSDCKVIGEKRPLKDGFSTSPMGCGTVNSVTIPAPDDPSVPTCDILTDCTNEPINPREIASGTYEGNPVLCNANPENPTQNPLCVQPCVLLPGKPAPIMQFISLKPFLLMIHDVGFVAPIQIPSSEPGITPFSDSGSSPTEKLFDVPLIIVPFDMLTPTTICGKQKLIYDNAVIFTLAWRARNGQTLEGKITADIEPNYGGWMVQKDNPEWTQRRFFYDGPGISSDEATTYRVFSTYFNSGPVPGFPDVLGTAETTIRFRNQKIFLPVFGKKKKLPMDKMKTIIFNDIDDVRGKCSIYQ